MCGPVLLTLLVSMTTLALSSQVFEIEAAELTITDLLTNQNKEMEINASALPPDMARGPITGGYSPGSGNHARHARYPLTILSPGLSSSRGACNCKQALLSSIGEARHLQPATMGIYKVRIVATTYEDIKGSNSSYYRNIQGRNSSYYGDIKGRNSSYMGMYKVGIVATIGIYNIQGRNNSYYGDIQGRNRS